MPRQVAATWTPDGYRVLKERYFAGDTMKKIADAVTNAQGWEMTRATIAARIYFFGWVRDNSRYKPIRGARPHPVDFRFSPAQAARKRWGKEVSPRVLVAQVNFPIAPAGERAVHLVDRTSAQCRFPVGEGTGVDQLFCGEPVVQDSLYCGDCRKRMFVPCR